VTNTGGATANAVMPSTPFKTSGAGTISGLGPTPAGGLAMAGNASQTYTWTFTGVSAGSLVLTGSVSGVDSNTLAAMVTPSSTVGVLIQTPAALSVTMYTTPATLKQGQAFNLVVSVTNTGQATATGVASVDGYVALSSLSYTSGPTPVGPFTILGGGTTSYVISYTPVAPNVNVTFTATLTGSDANTGASLTAMPSRTQFINGAAILGSWMSVGAVSLAGGETTMVTLTVTNGGTANALGVIPTLTATGDHVIAAPAGPYPASVGLMAPNAVRVFTWTVTGSSTGTANLTATVTGTNQPDSSVINTSAYGAVNCTSSLSSYLTVAPSEVKVGQTFQLMYTVTNANSVAASQATPFLLPFDTTLVTNVTGPNAPNVIPLNGNSSVTFTWTMTALKAGTITFSASSTADFVAPPPDGSVASLSLVIKKAVEVPAFDGETLVYPNPVTGDLINVAVRLKSAMSGIVLDVYNTGFQRVYHGEWPALPEGDSLLEITGAKSWAPGIYLARLTANKTDGGTQPFKTFRIAVKVAKR